MHNNNTLAKETSDMTNDQQQSQLVPISVTNEDGSRKHIQIDQTTETQLVLRKQPIVGSTNETETTSSYSATSSPTPVGQRHDAHMNESEHQLE